MASSIVTPPADKNLIRNPIYVTLESDLFTGSAPEYEPSEANLSCYLEVHQVIGLATPLIAALRGPYSSRDKQISFDVSRLLPRVIALPSAVSIGVSPGAGDPYYGEAEGLAYQWFLKHADQYGDPVVKETLVIGDTYLAINGGLPADAVQDINWAGGAIGLHTYYYRRASAFPFYKPVGRMQPDWMYFVALATDTFLITVTIHYSDGTTDVVTVLEMADITSNKAYWVQCGYAQLKIDDHADPDKDVVGYDVSLIRETGMQNTYTAFFVVDDMDSSWERYILFQNGFGGYETVRMKGITRYTHDVDRQSFERTRWIDFNTETGTMDDLSVLGGPVFNTHTGHYPKHYLNHLRQLLHGKLWLVDLELSLLNEYRFKKIQCLTNSIELGSDVPAADGFAISYRHGWLDDGFNVY